MDFEELTWREQEVLTLLGKRLTNREIATQLHLAESTVKDYVSNILGKLHVKNRRQAVERGKELRLLEREKTAVSIPKTNLPAETTPFIGRSDDLGEIKEQFERTRLLTLTGSGGVGKTRLALKIAAETAPNFDHGSFFVSLAPINSVTDIIQTIAEALKIPLATDEDPQVQLLRYLRKKQLLLVMDNFEHMLDGVHIVSEILLAAPSVKILATSRERLNLQSETYLNIGGLNFPNLGTSAELLNYDAMTLFVQKACQVQPSFDPSADEFKKIAIICRKVQGIPLAIELAAAWLHILSLNEITEELHQSFDILSSEMRDTPERHRSIRAVFEHTWSLIDEPEQEIFMQLSVFRGGFTREAAQQVAHASLPQLGALVNKSILSYDPKYGRFDMHELLRQYAQERLETNSQASQLAYETHAFYFADFMDSRWNYLKGSRQITAIKEIEYDIENIRSAWRFFVEKAEPAQLRKFINSFWLIYWIRGWNHAAVDLYGKGVKALIKLQKNEETEALLAIVKSYQGYFMTWLGLADKGYTLAKESVISLEHLNHAEGLIFAYNNLTLPAYFLQHVNEEKEAADKLLKIAQVSDDKWNMALASSLSSMASLRVRDYIDAQHWAEISLKISAEIEDKIISTLAHSTLGYIAIKHEEVAQAKKHYLLWLNISKEIGFHWAIGNSTKYLGQVALMEGNIGEAESYFQQSLKIAYDLGLARDIVNHLYEFARLRRAQDRAVNAVELLVLLLRQPASQQVRLGRGKISESAQTLLAILEEDLSPENFAGALQSGRNLELDTQLSELLNLNG